MFKQFKIAAFCMLGFGILPSAHADSTLVFESTAADGSKTEHTIALSGRWLKLESKPKAKADYVIMDTGRLLMFEVNDEEKSFQVTRMGRLYWPQTPLNTPRFKPMRKKQTVSGVACQRVHEMGPGKEPVAEHCMSAGGPLGLNAREMITLSRLFMSARRMGLPGWIGVATPEERQVSILSQNPEGVKQAFKSVSHKPLSGDLMKVPTGYKRLKPDLPPKEKRPKLAPAAKAEADKPETTKPESANPEGSDVPESPPVDAKDEPAKAQSTD